MILPELNVLNERSKQYLDFKGYNHTNTISENEFYEMNNISCDLYPALSVRKPRGTVEEYNTFPIFDLEKPNGLSAKNGLVWVDGTTFFYDGFPRGTVLDSKKQFASIGAYILILPDKKYYNTETDTFGDLESRYEQLGTAIITSCDINGNAVPSNTATYIKIAATQINENFKKYDGVTISGCVDSSLNRTFIIQNLSTGYLIVQGVMSSNTFQDSNLVVERKLPDMDFITEHENRLWGCSSTKHEVYACKLGDPLNWNCFEGISTDSYAVTIGSDGDFTGAVTYMGYVIFFKEDSIYKILGNKPSNFQVYSNSVRGVAKGAHNSLAVVNETLYYLSMNGIVAYTGNIPINVSEALGTEVYTDAIAGPCGNKYYVSMKNSKGIWNLFVYDESKRIWCKEDDLHVIYFAYIGGNLYYITDNSIKTISGTDNEIIKWYGEFGDFQEKTPNAKYLSKLYFNVELEPNSTFEVDIMYDNRGDWQKIATIYSKEKRKHKVLVKPRRCDYYKIRISGVGQCRLYSMVKSYIEGSDK
jgi:hypothetical protein